MQPAPADLHAVFAAARRPLDGSNGRLAHVRAGIRYFYAGFHGAPYQSASAMSLEPRFRPRLLPVRGRVRIELGPPVLKPPTCSAQHVPDTSLRHDARASLRKLGSKLSFPEWAFECTDFPCSSKKEPLRASTSNSRGSSKSVPRRRCWDSSAERQWADEIYKRPQWLRAGARKFSSNCEFSRACGDEIFAPRDLCDLRPWDGTVIQA